MGRGILIYFFLSAAATAYCNSANSPLGVRDLTVRATTLVYDVYHLPPTTYHLPLLFFWGGVALSLSGDFTACCFYDSACPVSFFCSPKKKKRVSECTVVPCVCECVRTLACVTSGWRCFCHHCCLPREGVGVVWIWTSGLYGPPACCRWDATTAVCRF